MATDDEDLDLDELGPGAAVMALARRKHLGRRRL
jgi:hypothetical protein